MSTFRADICSWAILIPARSAFFMPHCGGSETAVGWSFENF
jgi:hypothetical protein